MNDTLNDYVMLHVATIREQPEHAPAGTECKAVFVVGKPGEGHNGEAHFATKSLLTTLARLTKSAEAQGYAMPVSSIAFLSALESISTLEVVGHNDAPAKLIPELGRPGKVFNRAIPEA